MTIVPQVTGPCNQKGVSCRKTGVNCIFPEILSDDLIGGMPADGGGVVSADICKQ